MRSCTVDGCERRHYAKGLCQAHYRQARRAGRDLGPTWEECPDCGGRKRPGYVRCSRCRQSKGGHCMQCGGPMSESHDGGVCRDCRGRSHVQRGRRFERLWAQGATLEEIAADFGVSYGRCAAMLHSYRLEGYDLPYRHAQGPAHRRSLEIAGLA